MSFLYPGFLFALTAISIPVIIHLFSFRSYKTVYFSNIDFLKNLKNQSKSKSQLKHILILICRILAIAALVFAFAQPYIIKEAAKKNTSFQKVNIFIDNSFSMDSESKYGKLFENGKNKIRSILQAYSQSAKFILLDNNLEGKHQHWTDKEQINQFLQEINLSPVSKKISEIYTKQIDLFGIANNDSSETKKIIYIISDFQKSIADLENLKPDTNIQVYLIPIEKEKNSNLFIDTCWFESPVRKPNEPEKLFVRIKNLSKELYNDIPIKLYINDSIKSVSSFSIQPENTIVTELNFTNNKTGPIHCKIEISDYPVIFDNILYFTFTIYEKVNTLIINQSEPNKYIQNLFEDDRYFDLKNINSGNIQTSEFKNFQVIILNNLTVIPSGVGQELSNFIFNGGTVLLSPSLEAELNSYNTFLKQLNTCIFEKHDTTDINLEAINLQSSVYKNAFKKIENNAELPVIRNHYTFKKETFTLFEPLLLAQKNIPMAIQTQYGKGKIVLFNFQLTEKSGNFIKHPVFVPTIYNTLIQSQPNDDLYYTIGKPKNIEIPNTTLNRSEILHLKNTSGEYDYIPQITKNTNGNLRISIENSVQKSGNYDITEELKIVKGLSFNYNRAESEIESYSNDELKQFIKKYKLTNFSVLTSDSKLLMNEIKQIEQGRQLWKFFIILSLLFLGLEIFLIKFL